MKTIVFIASISAALAAGSYAETVSENSPEKTAVMAIDRAFEAAYATGNAKAIADFFTEDAHYTSDDGRTFDGRTAIMDNIRAALARNNGAKLAIAADSVRLLAPDVLLESGSTTVTAKNGETNGALYTTVYVKKDGKWKISQLVETPQPDLTAHDRLSELQWLVGNWEDADKSDDLTVSSQYSWARGGNFLTRNVTVKRGAETTLEGWQIIGWDPVGGCIRSWTFDDEGGFSEGRWTREGDRWLQRETGFTADGNRTSADNTFSKLSNDRFTWESNNRTLDGLPQPGIGRIEINRVKGH
ncbi:MAG TPA: SgcJ/EcaC family oxidoreductase [Candidatus Udaeobacter sp.]|nr:SgcJ/EcaC family oxidoreductase [Candidatus Udaeobacter sp.]